VKILNFPLILKEHIVSSTALKFIIVCLYVLLIRKPVPEVLLCYFRYHCTSTCTSLYPTLQFSSSLPLALLEYQFYTFPILFQHSCSTHTEYIPVSNTEIIVLTTFPWSFTIIQPGSIIRFLNNKIFTDKHSAQYKTCSLYETKFFQLLYSLLLAASIFSVVLWDNHEDRGSNLLRKVSDKLPTSTAT